MNWAYIAGFFDGEGCVRIGHNHFSLVIAQSEKNRGKHILTLIQAFVGIHGIDTKLQSAKLQRNQSHPMYYLRVGKRKNIIKFIRGVLPYLITKKVVAQDVMRYLIAFPVIRISGNKQKEFCGKGHSMVESNLLHYSGGRQCKTCRKQMDRTRYLRIKARLVGTAKQFVDRCKVDDEVRPWL